MQKEEGNNMDTSIKDNTIPTLDKKKKSILKEFIGKNSADIDLNKVRDAWKRD